MRTKREDVRNVAAPADTKDLVICEDFCVRK